MKQRLATAVIGLSIFFAVLAFYRTPFLNVSVAIVIFLSIYEIMQVTGLWRHKAIAGTCLLFGCGLPLLEVVWEKGWLPYYEALFALALFCLLLCFHETISYPEAATAFAVTCVISGTTSTLIWFRQMNERMEIGIFYTLLAFGIAWLTDTGAFLFGITLGKHKLAPKISPKKTVEGAVGGVVFCIGTVLLFSAIYCWICAGIWEIPVKVDYRILLLVVPLGSVLSMLGDLSASLIKRQCGVKDYGSLMPGHGGFVDQFDSVFFVLPFLFLFVQLFPIV